LFRYNQISAALDILQLDFNRPMRTDKNTVGVPIGATRAVVSDALPCNREFRAEYECGETYS
jgi:hypothetical protein